MRYLKTSEAAAFLSVSPNTLRAWERRFGFPKPQRSPGRHRLFTHGELAALRDALAQGLSISSAVSRAREGLTADHGSLTGALSGFESERADRALEAALAMRSLERSVEEVLLPSLEEIEARHGTDSAVWAFAARWSCDWLRRAQRMSPPPLRQEAILIGDASQDDLDRDAAQIRALELFISRAGLRVLSLSARAAGGAADALAAHRPDVIVIAGSHLDDDAVARWVYQARLNASSVPVALYRRGVGRDRGRGRGRTASAARLAATPAAAQSELLELVSQARRGSGAQQPRARARGAARRAA